MGYRWDNSNSLRQDRRAPEHDWHLPAESDNRPAELDASDQVKPGPDELLRWAMAMPAPTPERVRVNGRRIAEDLDRMYPAPRRVDWGAVNCVFWSVAVIVLTAVTIVALLP